MAYHRRIADQYDGTCRIGSGTAHTLAERAASVSQDPPPGAAYQISGASRIAGYGPEPRFPYRGLCGHQVNFTHLPSSTAFHRLFPGDRPAGNGYKSTYKNNTLTYTKNKAAYNENMSPYNDWICSTTRLVVSQVSQIWRIFCKNPPNLPVFSGSRSITEVIEQLYYTPAYRGEK
jgi:hypothetical protein